MANVLVCGEDPFALLRIGRELSNRGHAFDQTRMPVKKDDLPRYGLIVIHSSWRQPHLFEFIANLVHGHTIPVVYLSGDTAVGGFRPLLDDPWFAFIEDRRIDAELGVAAGLLVKGAKAFREQEEHARKALERGDLRRQMDRCKERLVATGMTEAEAHALILRTAMDRQITKYAACTLLLSEKNPEDD